MWQYQACAHGLRDHDDLEDLVKQALEPTSEGPFPCSKLLLLVMGSADKSNKMLTVSQLLHVWSGHVLRPSELHSARCLYCPEEKEQELDDTDW